MIYTYCSWFLRPPKYGSLSLEIMFEELLSIYGSMQLLPALNVNILDTLFSPFLLVGELAFKGAIAQLFTSYSLFRA